MDPPFFHFLAIPNDAVININMNVNRYLYLLEYLFLILFSIYLGVKLLSHRVILCLTPWRTSRFSHSSCTILHPISNVWGFQFLQILNNTCFLFFLIIAILVGSGISLWWGFFLMIVLKCDVSVVVKNVWSESVSCSVVSNSLWPHGL